MRFYKLNLNYVKLCKCFARLETYLNNKLCKNQILENNTFFASYIFFLLPFINKIKNQIHKYIFILKWVYSSN